MSDCLRFIAWFLCFCLIYSLKPPPSPCKKKKKNQTHVERKSFLLNLHRINCLTPAIINQMEFKRELNSIPQPVFLILLLFLHPQNSVHLETWRPETSPTPAFWPPGSLPLVKSVSIGSRGTLCTAKRLGKRRSKETPQPQFWTASHPKHVTGSTWTLSTAEERDSLWLERKQLTVSWLLFQFSVSTSTSSLLKSSK